MSPFGDSVGTDSSVSRDSGGGAGRGLIIVFFVPGTMEGVSLHNHHFKKHQNSYFRRKKPKVRKMK